MKSLALSFIAIFGFVFAGFAQAKTVDKAVIKTPMPNCEECKDFIESRLIREAGIISVVVNYRKGTTTVQWYTDRTNLPEIKIRIAYLGFDADDETADEIAYKKLPKCCKKPVETPKPAPPKKDN
jgi:periplasmic mercuric ion binding protein